MRRAPSFTPEQRAVINAGLVEILAEREAREWEAAIWHAAPVLVRRAAEQLIHYKEAQP
ncbi:hypothetical protein [Streptomyces sp. NPDC059874]|uniref:hypothetical protein n=1 Tax=Streptomyces sp. NPDC059874 TaxID=3346983 RepID=UPI00364CFF71